MDTMGNQLRDNLVAEMSARRRLLEEYCIKNELDSELNVLDSRLFTFLQENTKGILLLIESYADFCAKVDFISALMFDKIFALAQKRNIYIIGCFEPNDYKYTEGKALYSGFNPNNNALLLGGHFDKQTLLDMPNEIGVGCDLAYNIGFISYHGKVHPFVMPCGEQHAVEIDEDDQEIF